MRTLRADNEKYVKDLDRLREKQAEYQRSMNINKTSETSLRAQLYSAEITIRDLKLAAARTKTMNTQVRDSCATEVRRKDRQIETMRRQMADTNRARGSRTNSSITTITVTDDVRNGTQLPRFSSTSENDHHSRDNERVSSKMTQALVEENKQTWEVLRETLDQLKDMNGWQQSDRANEMGDQIERVPEWGTMKTELEMLLELTKTTLNSPSFVSIEEVEARDQEIHRLKDGWVKMETRWQEAVYLIDVWRKRMAANGEPVCEEELQLGLRLSPMRMGNVEAAESGDDDNFGLSAVAEEAEESLQATSSSPCPIYREPTSADSIFGEEGCFQPDKSEEPTNDSIDGRPLDVEEEPEIPSSPLPEPPQLRPLKKSASAGNRGIPRTSRKRQCRESSAVVGEESKTTKSVQQEPEKPLLPQLTSNRNGTIPSATISNKSRSVSNSSLDDALLTPSHNKQPLSANRQPKLTAEVDINPSKETTLRNPLASPSKPTLRPAEGASSQRSPSAKERIAAKLAASERDAEAARVRAKMEAVRGSRGVKRPIIDGKRSRPNEGKENAPGGIDNDYESHHGQDKGVDALKPNSVMLGDEQEVNVEKRKRDKRQIKGSSRRRSTLSPWELESLITGNVE